MEMKYLVFFALITIASAGLVRRDAPQESPNSVKSFFDNAEKSLEEVKQTFLKVWGFENEEQLQNSIKENGKALASNVDEYLKKLQQETENLKDNEVVKDLRERAEKLGEELKSKHPETVAEVENINKSVAGIIEKAKSIAKSQEAENVRKTAVDLLEQAQTALQKVVTEVKENIKQ